MGRWEDDGMRRIFAFFAAIPAVLVLLAAPAFACAGLIGPNGAVNLLRTTTFAGYHDGVEHYVTAFQFAGGSGQFGSLVPLPGIPTEIIRGGDWTLSLSHGTLEVRDITASRRFYSEFLGLETVQRGNVAIWIRCGGGWMVACVCTGDKAQPLPIDIRW